MVVLVTFLFQIRISRKKPKQVLLESSRVQSYGMLSSSIQNGSSKIFKWRTLGQAREMMDRRIYGFDFLRGICAIGVAYYLILGWLGASHIKLYNVGLYGVYIFFILSGASIYIAYSKKILAGYDLRKFLALRLFRLLPLFAVVVMVGPLIDNNGNLTGYNLEFFQKAILNITFYFGIGNPGKISLPTGGWSLGIEFLFYLLFPTILGFVSASTYSGVLLLAGVFILQVIFVGYQINGPEALVKRWSDYIQLASLASYFVAGCLVGRYLIIRPVSKNILYLQLTAWIFFCTSFLIILLTSADFAEASVRGKRGVLLPIICMLLVIAAAHLAFMGKFKLVATGLGNMSYGMYLLHPLIFSIAMKFAPEFIKRTPVNCATLLIVCTGICALLVERYFERPINIFGKRLLDSKRSEVLRQ